MLSHEIWHRTLALVSFKNPQPQANKLSSPSIASFVGFHNSQTHTQLSFPSAPPSAPPYL